MRACVRVCVCVCAGLDYESCSHQDFRFCGCTLENLQLLRPRDVSSSPPAERRLSAVDAPAVIVCARTMKLKESSQDPDLKSESGPAGSGQQLSNPQRSARYLHLLRRAEAPPLPFPLMDLID